MKHSEAEPTAVLNRKEMMAISTVFEWIDAATDYYSNTLLPRLHLSGLLRADSWRKDVRYLLSPPTPSRQAGRVG